MNLYIQTLFESAHAASIIPFGSEISHIAMRVYGGYNIPLACALAIAGGALGHAFNFGIGKTLKALHEQGTLRLKEKWYNDAAYFFNRGVFFLLLFCWLPFFNVLSLIAGFLGTGFYITMTLATLGLVGRYLWLLSLV
jgi:membrane protein YqaA with SNARE-associated domain